jgi:aryl-alcohol dehydrogenase-like predicted oxidoreductase
MARLAGDGKIAAVGVSNFSARQLEQASQVLGSQGMALASNEVQISLLHRNIERNGVLAAARLLGVTLIAYSPQRSGILTSKFHDDLSRIRAVSPLQRRLLGLNDAGLARTRR